MTPLAFRWCLQMEDPWCQMFELRPGVMKGSC